MPTPESETTRPLDVTADLRFSVELPGREPVSGTLTGSGSRLDVRLDDPAFFAGGRDAAGLRDLAATLADLGLTLVVSSGDVVLLELGRTDPSWWQRRVNRSRHLKIASVRGALAGARGRVRGAATSGVLPGPELLPPAAVLPLAGFFAPRERTVTTTHDPRRAGRPRLVMTTANPARPAGAQVLFPLLAERTTIGSAAECDIVLPGLAPVHAEVVHDDRDEFVIRGAEAGGEAGAVRIGDVRVGGAPVGDGRVLRTGARISLGPWTLAYRRAEYADHGRPYGGRIGGEAGHQRPQPPRPAASSAGRAVAGPRVVLDPRGLR